MQWWSDDARDAAFVEWRLPLLYRNVSSYRSTRLPCPNSAYVAIVAFVLWNWAGLTLYLLPPRVIVPTIWCWPGRPKRLGSALRLWKMLLLVEWLVIYSIPITVLETKIIFCCYSSRWFWILAWIIVIISSSSESPCLLLQMDPDVLAGGTAVLSYSPSAPRLISIWEVRKWGSKASLFRRTILESSEEKFKTCRKS